MTIFSTTVAASADDARENSGVMGLTSSTMNLGGAPVNFGFRFLNVTVPQGATINAGTKMTVDVPSTSADSPNGCGVMLEDADNAAAFTSTNNDITNRTKTSAATWSGTDIGAGAKDTPDLAAQVQTVVNRAGWASGNAMVVIVDGVQGSDLTVTAYDGTPASAATLTINYTSASGGGTITRVMHHLRQQGIS